MVRRVASDTFYVLQHISPVLVRKHHNGYSASASKHVGLIPELSIHMSFLFPTLFTDVCVRMALAINNEVTTCTCTAFSTAQLVCSPR